MKKALEDIVFFASGSNHSGEIRALSLVPGANVGVVAARIDPAGPAAVRASSIELDRFSYETGRSVFVDSGAFEEVTFPGGVPTISKPLSAAHWDRVFRVYENIALHAGPRAFLVAPDCVAHQAESLERLERYSERLEILYEMEATILVPVQKGELSMADFWGRAVDAIGLPGDELVPAIPMKKDATSLEDLRAFLLAVRPSAVHLLGIAPDTERGRAAIELVRSIVPSARISCDACLAKRLVGRTNGRNGGPRVYTELSDLFAAKLASTVEAKEDLAEIIADNEVHLRKALAFFFAVRRFWIDLGLAHEPLPAVLDLPGDVAAELEAVYLPLAVSVFGGDERGHITERPEDVITSPPCRDSSEPCMNSILSRILSTPLSDRAGLTVLEAREILRDRIEALGSDIPLEDALRVLVLRFAEELPSEPDVDGRPWEDEVAWNYRHAIGPVS
jgi:hypothetical protein